MERIAAVEVAGQSKPRSKKPEQASISSIERVDRRAELKPRPAPHWKMIVEGRYIGFRKMTRGSPGNWLARAWSDAEKRYNQKPLGGFADKPEGERYDAALAAAQAWFDHLDHGGSTKAVSVKDACEAYIAERKSKSKASAAKGAAGCFKRIVYNDPIASVELSKLTANHCSAWRQRVEAALTKRGSKNPKGSVNRSLVPLVAALNLALRRRNVASDHAWAQELKKDTEIDGKPVDGKREVWLDRAERGRLLAAMSDEAKAYVTALCLLPVRPGVPMHLTVKDFDAKLNSLHIPKDKEHAGRSIAVGNGTLTFLKAQCASKLPSAFIFTQADGAAWTGNALQKHMRAAVAKAGLPKAACAYSIRHGVITDMLSANVNIFLVAKIAGTSPEMIMKTYGRVIAADVVKALATLELAA